MTATEQDTDPGLDQAAYVELLQRQDGVVSRRQLVELGARPWNALTVRLTYGQVFRHGCRTIAAVAELLGRRGWQGELQHCPDCQEQPGAAVPAGGT